MAWSPISGTLPQYQKSDGTLASGYYIKFYQEGTTAAFSMATDDTGGSTLAKAQLDSSGYPITGGSARFIPHVNQDYKIVLYKNATDADNDTTGNADWVIDTVPRGRVSADVVEDSVESLSTLINSSLSADNILVKGYYTGWAATANGPIGGHYRHKTGATNTAPTVGSPVSVSTIGHGTQAGYCWDASGVEWFISQPGDGVYEASAFGVLSDNSGLATPDGRDNATELQDFFTFMKGRANIFRLPPQLNEKNIYTSQPITMQVDSASNDVFSPILDGNNNVITMRGSGYTGSTSVLKIGASSASVPGGQKIVVRDFEIIGPLSGDASFVPKTYTSTTAPAHTGAGIEVENWINIEFQNTVVQGCYIGFQSEKTWPITEINCRAENCYVGWFIKGTCTSRTSIRSRALGCRWALIMQPDASESIYGQIFHGFHLENCLMGVVLDPADGGGNGIHDANFYDVYIEGLGYNDGADKSDIFRVAKSVDILDVTSAGSNRSRSVYNFVFDVAAESYTTNPSLGGIQAQFGGSSNTVKGVRIRNTRLLPSMIVNWASALSREWYAGFNTNFGDRNFTLPQGEFGFNFQTTNATALGAITPSSSFGEVSIEKTANGVYTITYPDTNAAALDPIVTHSVDRAAFVTFDPKTTSTMEMRVYDDIGGTLAGAEPRVFVNFKQPT